jgi:protease-4
MRYFNVIDQPIKSGANIDLGSTAHKLSPEQRQLLQQIADHFHTRFQNAVLAGRPGVDRTQKTTFDGRVFTADQALELHLIDQVGYLDDALDRAAQQAKLSSYQVVLLRRSNDPAYSIYATTPNVPLQTTAWPVSVPGLDRSRLPAYLYLWQPDATLEKLRGK